MNNEKFKVQSKIIKKIFKDNRKIKSTTSQETREINENIYSGGDVYTTENSEYIDLEMQLIDFDEDELKKRIEFAEALYEKNHKHVSIYILCRKDIKIHMKERKIISDADFKISLRCIQEDGCKLLLKSVKSKIKSNVKLNEDDLYNLHMLPILCKRDEINYYNKECFKIINNNHY